jgi:hypothetical protein
LCGRLGSSSSQGAFILIVRKYISLDEQTQTILTNIINHADAGQHVPFRFLKTWREYRTMKGSKKVTKMIIKNLQYTDNLLFTRYCKDNPEHTADFTKLLICRTLRSTLDFYKTELETISDMVDEYECYLLSGNFLDFVLYGTRPDHKLKDYR